jgi:hypothetical protein
METYNPTTTITEVDALEAFKNSEIYKEIA